MLYFICFTVWYSVIFLIIFCNDFTVNLFTESKEIIIIIIIYCSHEVGNPFDPFAIKVCKDDGEIVGHLHMEISRVTKFLLDRGFTSTVH